MGFAREMVYSASWYSFFAAPPTNRLYGDLTAPLRTSEGSLFPGVVVILLAIAGVWASRTGGGTRAHAPGDEVRTSDADNSRRRAAVPTTAADAEPPRGALWAYRFAGALMAVAALVVVGVSLTGGINLSILGVALRANDFQNPLTGLAVALLARMLLRRGFPALPRPQRWLSEPQRFYAGLLLAGALLSLGASGPYRLLHAYVPGFDGVRAVARIHILTLFCLAVFVAYGTRAAVDRLTRSNAAWATALIPALMLMEFFSAPISQHQVQWGDDVPEVYAWLARQPGDHAAIEYPLEVRLEFDRMLYSAVHEKKVVNGMSGYESPVYQEMRLRMDQFPSRSTIDDIRDLGVRWVVVHRDRFGERGRVIVDRLTDFEQELVLVAEFGDTLVFETRGTPWLSRDQVRSEPIDTSSIWTPLPSAAWKVRANALEHLAPLAVDGDLETRWNTGPQKPGDEFIVDFGEKTTFGNIAVWLYTHPHDYPRGYRVEVSDDGETWSTVARARRVHVPIARFIEPLEQPFQITFAENTARYLKIVQTGSHPVYVWSIHELEVRRRNTRTGGVASIPSGRPGAGAELGRRP
jgi:hypothetical protein